MPGLHTCTCCCACVASWQGGGFAAGRCMGIAAGFAGQVTAWQRQAPLGKA